MGRGRRAFSEHPRARPNMTMHDGQAAILSRPPFLSTSPQKERQDGGGCRFAGPMAATNSSRREFCMFGCARAIDGAAEVILWLRAIAMQDTERPAP